jgi:ribonuclease J
MRACIRRGAHQIGGSCVELESQGSRILLDLGLPLDSEPELDLLPPVSGLASTDESLLGVFVSHPHQDHFGLLPYAAAHPRVFMGADAARILEAASLFWPGAAGLPETEALVHKTPINLGPFCITPYLVDHSAYDAYALLVEADGERLFYSGDLRAHGRKGRLFEQLLREGIPDIDVLLLEGTTLGRPADEPFPTEQELEVAMEAAIKETPGLVLVWASGMNIDRLVTIFKAARRSGRTLIMDMYSASVLRAASNENLPQAEWEGVRVYLPRSQKMRIIHEKAFELARSFSSHRIYPEDLAGYASRSVMLFRPGMRWELEEARCLEGAHLIYSLWEGYLKDEKQLALLAWLKEKAIPLSKCHTSGHASAADLTRLVAALAPRALVPIHSEVPERFLDLFRSAVLRGDGEWWAMREAG